MIVNYFENQKERAVQWLADTDNGKIIDEFSLFRCE